MDGLRGVAIIAVMLAHLVVGQRSIMQGVDVRRLSRLIFSAAIPGGYGVDLFFVLSGFLITGILYDSKGAPHYFRNFYMRRTLRIFPLYYGTLAVIFIVIPLVRPYASPEAREIVRDQAWLWGYATNVLIGLRGLNRLAGASLHIAHFWSLAVEEHFYLVWPLVVLLFRRRALMVFCVGLVIVSVALRSILLAAHLADWFLFTPARMDGLAMGSFLALAARGPCGIDGCVRPARWAAPGLAVLIACLVPLSGAAAPLVQVVKVTVVSAFFAAVLVLAVGGRTRVFNSGALAFFGKYSYGLYVFHALLLPGMERLFPSRQLADRFGSFLPVLMVYLAVAFGVNILLALASWHLYEKHFLKLKRRFS